MILGGDVYWLEYLQSLRPWRSDDEEFLERIMMKDSKPGNLQNAQSRYTLRWLGDVVDKREQGAFTHLRIVVKLLALVTNNPKGFHLTLKQDR